LLGSAESAELMTHPILGRHEKFWKLEFAASAKTFIGCRIRFGWRLRRTGGPDVWHTMSIYLENESGGNSRGMGCEWKRRWKGEFGSCYVGSLGNCKPWNVGIFNRFSRIYRWES